MDFKLITSLLDALIDFKVISAYFDYFNNISTCGLSIMDSPNALGFDLLQIWGLDGLFALGTSWTWLGAEWQSACLSVYSQVTLAGGPLLLHDKCPIVP